MGIKLTDDEVAAIGSLNGGWPWALLTVETADVARAVERGQRSLLVRDLITDSGPSELLLRIASFAASDHTIASAVVRSDGTPDIPVIQVLLISGGDGNWLLDARLPVGIHRMDVVDVVGAREYLLTLCHSFAADADSRNREQLALLSAVGDIRGGVVIGTSVRRAYRDGERVGFGEVIAERPSDADWVEVVNGLLGNS